MLKNFKHYIPTCELHKWKMLFSVQNFCTAPIFPALIWCRSSAPKMIKITCEDLLIILVIKRSKIIFWSNLINFGLSLISFWSFWSNLGKFLAQRSNLTLFDQFYLNQKLSKALNPPITGVIFNFWPKFRHLRLVRGFYLKIYEIFHKILILSKILQMAVFSHAPTAHKVMAKM